MKKIITILTCLLTLFVLTACGTGGNVSNVNVPEVKSNIYSQEDISSAIETIKKEFKADWKGCTLTEIYYAGDERTKDETEYYLVKEKVYDADELIVLLSSFDTDYHGGDGSLNQNDTYDSWNWILVRTNGDKWKHVDHGY